MARPTDDKKDKTIKLRVNSDMRNYLEDKAYKNGVSVSECIRQIIKTDMKSNKH